jgi:hypothetical protein
MPSSTASFSAKNMQGQRCKKMGKSKNTGRFIDEADAKKYLAERGADIKVTRLTAKKSFKIIALKDPGLKVFGAIDYLVNFHHYVFLNIVPN